jgi:RNA polymerase sigma-B factor
VSTTIPHVPNHAVLDVRPGEEDGAAQVEAWLGEYATSRDPVLRERIILAYLGLADRLAGRYRHSRGTTPQDLAPTAGAWLIAAIDRYDPDCGSPFVAYAVACVVGELKRHLRDTSWRLHVPRPHKERDLRLCQAADELHQHLGRSPTTTELADHLAIDEEAVLEGLAAVTSRQELSLDQPIWVREDASGCLGDLVAAPGAREEPEDLLALTGMLAALPKLEREVIVLRFLQDLSQYEIAARSASPRCMSPGSSAAPWPVCAPSWWTPDLGKGRWRCRSCGWCWSPWGWRSVGSSASRWHRISRPGSGAADPPLKRQPHGLSGDGCSGRLTKANGI